VNDIECKDVEAVFARGSGQDVDGKEATAFNDKLSARVKGVLTTNTYELGSAPLLAKNTQGTEKSYQFPAVPVNGEQPTPPPWPGL
jgi:hypothetical protein